MGAVAVCDSQTQMRAALKRIKQRQKNNKQQCAQVAKCQGLRVNKN